MSEPGSDAMFPDWGDLDHAGHPLVEEDERLAAEEARVSAETPAEDEPGEQHPDLDGPPPADEAHPEFDPTPSS